MLKKYMILILGFIILGIIVIYYSYKEGYEAYPESNHTPIKKYLSTINPLGNTLMSDYTYNPTKKDSIEKLPIHADKSYGKTPSYESQYNSSAEKNINDKTKEFIYENNKNNFPNRSNKQCFRNRCQNCIFIHSLRSKYVSKFNSAARDIHAGAVTSGDNMS